MSNLSAGGRYAASAPSQYFVLYPNSKVLGLIIISPVRISAWFFLGFWFLYQLVEANFGLFSSSANGGGIAFFANVGGLLFGVAVAWSLLNAGRIAPQDTDPLGPTV